MTLRDVWRITGAAGECPVREEVWVHGVRTDSRLVDQGDLFLCLPGQNADGHDFAADALNKGAAAIMAQRPLGLDSGKVPVLYVTDCLWALAELASFWRERFRGKVIGITGSAGKTSVKEFLACILNQGAETGKSYKNWNNRLGVPLSILGCSAEEDFWVLEAGVNQRGEMRELARIIRPDLGVIHNIGPVHLEGLQGLEGVAREKAELINWVRKGGYALLGKDYPLLISHLPARWDLDFLLFSLREKGADFTGEYLGLEGNRGVYSLCLQGSELRVSLGFPGEHQLENVLAAASAAWILGCDREAIENGLHSAELPEHRSHLLHLGSWRLIDDSYNSNPLSVHPALQSARELSGKEPLLAFLGDMFELGESAEQAHYDLGKAAAEQEVTHLFYGGEFASAVKKGFTQAGGENFHPVEGVEEFIRLWRDLDLRGGTVLFKASRGCGLERFVQALRKELQQ